MTGSNYKKTTIILSLAGLLFSGYLSAVKLITSTCALSEPCPYFLGFPACWYGFAMFTILFVTALFGFLKQHEMKTVATIETIVSALGILFAGYFTISEVGHLFLGVSTYSLGLPTCAYGLIFYVIIFVLSISYLKSKKNQTI